MRLIIEISTGADYVASWVDTFGLEYESKEKFLFDLELCAITTIKTSYGFYCLDDNFEFCGMNIRYGDILYVSNRKLVFMEPNVYTVDEWFEQELKERQRTIEG